MQRDLTRTLGTAGATHVRFLFALPFAVVLVLAVIAAYTHAYFATNSGVEFLLQDMWFAVNREILLEQLRSWSFDCAAAASRTLASATLSSPLATSSVNSPDGRSARRVAAPTIVRPSGARSKRGRLSGSASNALTSEAKVCVVCRCGL